MGKLSEKLHTEILGPSPFKDSPINSRKRQHDHDADGGVSRGDHDDDQAGQEIREGLVTADGWAIMIDDNGGDTVKMGVEAGYKRQKGSEQQKPNDEAAGSAQEHDTDNSDGKDYGDSDNDDKGEEEEEGEEGEEEDDNLENGEAKEGVEELEGAKDKEGEQERSAFAHIAFRAASELSPTVQHQGRGRGGTGRRGRGRGRGRNPSRGQGRGRTRGRGRGRSRGRKNHDSDVEEVEDDPIEQVEPHKLSAIAGTEGPNSEATALTADLVDGPNYGDGAEATTWGRRGGRWGHGRGRGGRGRSRGRGQASRGGGTLILRTGVRSSSAAEASGDRDDVDDVVNVEDLTLMDAEGCMEELQEPRDEEPAAEEPYKADPGEEQVDVAAQQWQQRLEQEAGQLAALAATVLQGTHVMPGLGRGSSGPHPHSRLDGSLLERGELRPADLLSAWQHHHSALEESGRMLRQVLQFTIAAAGGGGGADFQQYSERGRGGWRGRGRGGRDRG